MKDEQVNCPIIVRKLKMRGEKENKPVADSCILVPAIPPFLPLALQKLNLAQLHQHASKEVTQKCTLNSAYNNQCKSPATPPSRGHVYLFQKIL
jgi:hypothetical protein